MKKNTHFLKINYVNELCKFENGICIISCTVIKCNTQYIGIYVWYLQHAIKLFRRCGVEVLFNAIVVLLGTITEAILAMDRIELLIIGSHCTLPIY